MTATPLVSPTARLVGVVVRGARQDQETAGCRWPSRESAGGPLLGALELVEAEQGIGRDDLHDPDLTGLYAEAARMAGHPARQVDGQSAFLAGTRALAELLD